MNRDLVSCEKCHQSNIVKLDSQNERRQLLIAGKKKKNFLKNIMVKNVCKFYENHCLLNSKSSTIFNQNINKKMFNNEYLDIFVKNQFTVYVYVYFQIPCCLTSVTHVLVYNNLVSHEIQGASLNFALHFLDCLGYFCSLHFHIHFRISLSKFKAQ